MPRRCGSEYRKAAAFRGENFLVGIDASLKSEASLQFETFKLNAVLSLLEARAGTTLLFWDACRNNPLAEELARSVSLYSTRAINELGRSGAAPLAPRRGDTLVVFSAEPGSVALDGSGDYSPFAASLGQYMPTANLEIESMLKRVTRDVIENTRNAQRPERLSQLTRDFYFHSVGSDTIAYEEELSKLRAKLAQLEREPAKVRRYRILSADQVSSRKSVKVATRGGTAANPPELGSDNGLPAVEETSSIGAGAPNTAAGSDDVVVAVNKSAATVVRKLRISPDGKLLALGDDNGRIRIVGLETFEVIRTIRAHTSRVADLDFSPDSQTLLSAGRDGMLAYWDLKTGKKQRQFSLLGAIPYSVSINSAFPDRWVLMGDRSGRLVGWDLKANRIITNSKLYYGPVHSVGYQPGGKGTRFSGGSDGNLKVRFAEGKHLTLHAHTGPLFHAAYSKSGKLVYTTGADHKVKIWDATRLDRPDPLHVLEGHLRYVIAADMSPDERMLVSGGGDKLIYLWNVSSGALIGKMEGHTSDVEAVAFSPDGKLVVSASEDKTVRIWSVDSREELVRLLFKKDSEQYAGVTLDNQQFGDQNSGLISVFISGREVTGPDVEPILPYIGRQIAIIDSGNLSEAGKR